MSRVPVEVAREKFNLTDEDIKSMQDDFGFAAISLESQLFFDEKQLIFYLLLKKAQAVHQFIREVLGSMDTANSQVLESYISVLEEFIRKNDPDVLDKLKMIMYRPSVEGASADFTESTSAEFKGTRVRLYDLLKEITQLLEKYRGIE